MPESDLAPRVLLLTCEHGGNKVPTRWRSSFRGFAALRDSHRGFDPGALSIARAISARLGAPLIASTTTRLLVDLNRSESNRGVFSEVTRDLPDEEREHILAAHHRPYRAAVAAAVDDLLGSGASAGGVRAAGPAVVHVSCHSFTPVLDGRRRALDIGLLYDPQRAVEAELCKAWRRAVHETDRSLDARGEPLRVRMNQPYRGVSDGVTRWLRTRFPDGRYAGIELEVNQAITLGPKREFARLTDVVVESLTAVLSAQDRVPPRASSRRETPEADPTGRSQTGNQKSTRKMQS